jgi:hypothetical protein
MGGDLFFSLISIFHHPHVFLYCFLKEKVQHHSPLLETDFTKKNDSSKVR